MTERCWKNVKWERRFVDARIEVDVRTQIRRTGKQLDTLKGGDS
jgi:hypothetical protein